MEKLKFHGYLNTSHVNVYHNHHIIYGDNPLNLNTSHVNVYHNHHIIYGDNPLNLNTSHVNVYLMKLIYQRNI